ncbi:MAG TPA: hypothetical protein VNM66_02450 [Thermodesulfobacteriota bacterium]|nr:hypothetical protein [Thermodesulfobacteriota bacterium]
MTSSRTAWPTSDAERGAAAELADLLRTIVRRPTLHARWLNTLSMLEAVGAQKIARSQPTARLPAAVVRHLAEESRHADYLKRLAGRVAPGACPTYERDYLLAGRPARRYFERLDAAVTHRLDARGEPRGEPAGAAYLYVTLAIERRASRLYPLYQRVLDEAAAGLSLRGVIEEEGRHLAEIEQRLAARDPAWPALAAEFEAVESAFFAAWLRALARVVEQAGARAEL